MSGLPVRTSAVLRVLSGNHKGKQFRLLSSKITLGRHSDCDVVFKDNPHCSRYHARIERKDDGVYIIESLNPKNPVIINKKTISSHILKAKDKISIGKIELLFLDQASLPPASLPSRLVNASPQHAPPLPNNRPPSKQQGKWLSPPRLILLALLCGGAYLFTVKENKTEQQPFSLKKESEILKEMEDLKKLNEEESEKQSLTYQDKAARAAFIAGYRDYRKGYFHRALKMFRHCLTLRKTHPLCQSYSRKSKTQIDKLIQKKIRLGNLYKKNKQYEACQAAFKSVETMIKDTASSIYKTARENRKLCEIQLKNKI